MQSPTIKVDVAIQKLLAETSVYKTSIMTFLACDTLCTTKSFKVHLRFLKSSPLSVYYLFIIHMPTLYVNYTEQKNKPNNRPPRIFEFEVKR